MGPDRLGNGPGYRHRAPLGPKHPWFGVDSVYICPILNLGFDRGTAPNQNGSVKEAPALQTTKKTKNQRSSPSTDHLPVCVGPNIHGGAEAWRADRLDVPDLFASFWIKPKKRRTAPLQNRSVKKVPVTTPNQKKHRTDALPHQQTTSQRALARTSTGEQRPCGLADWMFLIFLLLFGSSQKEGERLHPKTVESKNRPSSHQQTTFRRAPAQGRPQCPVEHCAENGLIKVNSRLADYKCTEAHTVRTIFVRDALRNITDSIGQRIVV